MINFKRSSQANDKMQLCIGFTAERLKRYFKDGIK